MSMRSPQSAAATKLRSSSNESSSQRNSFGLFSEDADYVTGELWGNFPQTYSMVGLINAAVRLSRSWEDAF